MGSWTLCPPCLLAAGDGRSSFSVRQRDHCAGSSGVRRNLQKKCHSNAWVEMMHKYLCVLQFMFGYSTWLLLWWDFWYLFIEVLVALVQTTSNCLVDAVDCVSGSGKNTVRLELVQSRKLTPTNPNILLKLWSTPKAGMLWCIEMYLYVLICTCMYVSDIIISLFRIAPHHLATFDYHFFTSFSNTKITAVRVSTVQPGRRLGGMSNATAMNQFMPRGQLKNPTLALWMWSSLATTNQWHTSWFFCWFRYTCEPIVSPISSIKCFFPLSFPATFLTRCA